MKTRQYAYFAVRSASLDAAAIAARIGIAPDEIGVKDSRRPGVPKYHAWKLCSSYGRRVDDQIAELMPRLAPARAAIAALVAEGHPASLQVVRYFGADDGEPGIVGWHLERAVIEFLAATGAEIDVDEYDVV